MTHVRAARWLRSGAVLLLVPLLTGCVTNLESHGYTAREEHRFTVTGVPRVNLVTFDGSIEVTAWDRDEVRIDIERRGQSQSAIESLEVVAEQDGDTVHVEVRRPTATGLFSFSGQSAHVWARVPERVELRAQSGDGGIRVERVTGAVELRSGDGAIHGLHLDGRVNASTGDGAMRFERLRGEVELTTGDGGIVVEGQLQTANVRTGDGAISVRVEPGSRMSGPWEIVTGDGGMAVYLPDDFDAELDVRTNDGRVRADREVEARLAGRLDRQEARGQLGAGGPVLRLRTGDGTISLRAR